MSICNDFSISFYVVLHVIIWTLHFKSLWLSYLLELLILFHDIVGLGLWYFQSCRPSFILQINFLFNFFFKVHSSLFWWKCTTFWRLANIYPSSWLVNCNRKDRKQISVKFQHALWYSGKNHPSSHTLDFTLANAYYQCGFLYLQFWCIFWERLWCVLLEGLRGAMAFALALQSVSDLPNNGDGRIILTSTLFTIFFTVSLTWIRSHDSRNEDWRILDNLFVNRTATDSYT